MPECPVCGSGVPLLRPAARGGRGYMECPVCRAKLKYTKKVSVAMWGLLPLWATVWSVVAIAGIVETPYLMSPAYIGLWLMGIIGSLIPFWLIPFVYLANKGSLVVIERRPRCSYCNTVITQENPEFCPHCGERLTAEDLKGVSAYRAPRHKK